VSAFVYLQPVLTALMAISILGERPSARLIQSAVLIAAGVAVTIHEQRAREKGPSPAGQSMVEVRADSEAPVADAGVSGGATTPNDQRVERSTA
jgi:hypothetical protein